MTSITLYHNPRCSKSRAAKQLLEQRGLDFHLVEYLTTPLDEEQLEQLRVMLGCEASDLCRPKEAQQAGIGELTGRALLLGIAKHPEAMQRPIVVVGERAVIGRPPEQILELLPQG